MIYTTIITILRSTWDMLQAHGSFTLAQPIVSTLVVVQCFGNTRQSMALHRMISFTHNRARAAMGANTLLIRVSRAITRMMSHAPTVTTQESYTSEAAHLPEGNLPLSAS